jgi:hypothetical protein
MKRKQSPAEKPFLESFAERAGLNKLKKTDKPRLYYLCGAITNDPHAKLKFDLAELYLVNRGDLVINPMKANPTWMTWGDALSNDLFILEKMKAIYVNALQLLNNISGNVEFRMPTLVFIDPTERRFDSKGTALEKRFAGTLIPVVELGGAWDKILLDAIAEKESEVEE